MNIVRLKIIALALLASITYAETTAPSFRDFQAKERFTGSPAPVEITSHPKAGRFRTVLRRGAKSGPNFAGHFTIVTWGCGTACQEFAIVDAKTGRVYFPSSIRLNAYQMVHDETEPFQYRKDSNLLIIAGSPDDEEDKLGLFYYEWTGHDFKLIQEVKRTFEPKK